MLYDYNVLHVYCTVLKYYSITSLSIQLNYFQNIMELFQTFMLVEFALQGCNHHSKQNITLLKADEF